jgi:four helix bundle protein
MTEKENSKQYDLEDRTLEFAKRVRKFVAGLKNTPANMEDRKQLIRSSGSIGANYIEANEALSKKDFLMRIKICRKEAKESWYWLRLIDTDSKDELEKQRKALENEARELTHIFGSIVTKSK